MGSGIFVPLFANADKRERRNGNTADARVAECAARWYAFTARAGVMISCPAAPAAVNAPHGAPSSCPCSTSTCLASTSTCLDFGWFSSACSALGPTLLAAALAATARGCNMR